VPNRIICLNDPVNWIDPEGLEEFPFWPSGWAAEDFIGEGVRQQAADEQRQRQAEIRDFILKSILQAIDTFGEPISLTPEQMQQLIDEILAQGTADACEAKSK
jgi:hypothetical protein